MEDQKQGEPIESPAGFPQPDRSGYRPNFTKTAENDCLDLGWADGRFSDGRPYRMEVWAMDGMTGLTYFFSTQGLEKLTREACTDFLEREGHVKFLIPERRGVGVTPWTDYSGHPMWSISVLVGDEDGVLVESGIPYHGYNSGPGK